MVRAAAKWGLLASRGTMMPLMIALGLLVSASTLALERNDSRSEPASSSRQSGLADSESDREESDPDKSDLGTSDPDARSNWRFIPSITVSESYSDNIELRPSGEEEGDFVTQLNPGFTLNRKGGRLDANIRYQMQNLIYAREGDRNETFQQLNARSTAELLREILFVDTDAAISQQLIDARQRVALSNIAVTGNRADVKRFSISPYLRHRFGTIAETELRYRYGIVDFSESSNTNSIQNGSNNINLLRARNVRDTERNGVSLLATSLTRLQEVGWRAKYDHDIIRGSSGAENKFEVATLDLGYPVNSDLDVQVLAGYENNDFAGVGRDTRGAIYGGGFNWRPTPYDDIRAAFSKRFFGNYYDVKWARKRRLVTTELGYTQSVSTLTQTLLGSSLQDGAALDSPGGLNGELTNDTLSLRPDVFVRSRFDAKIFLVSPRNNVRLNVYQEERDYLSGDLANEQVVGLNASWERQLARKFFTLGRLLYRRDEFGETGQQDDLGRLSAGLRWELESDTSASMEASHTRRKSDNEDGDYRENAVTVRLKKEF